MTAAEPKVRAEGEVSPLPAHPSLVNHAEMMQWQGKRTMLQFSKVSFMNERGELLKSDYGLQCGET